MYPNEPYNYQKNSSLEKNWIFLALCVSQLKKKPYYFSLLSNMPQCLFFLLSNGTIIKFSCIFLDLWVKQKAKTCLFFLALPQKQKSFLFFSFLFFFVFYPMSWFHAQSLTLHVPPFKQKSLLVHLISHFIVSLLVLFPKQKSIFSSLDLRLKFMILLLPS